MIDRQRLLSDLQDVLETLEADLLERSESDEVPAVGEKLRAEYERAKIIERSRRGRRKGREGAKEQEGTTWTANQGSHTEAQRHGEGRDPCRFSILDRRSVLSGYKSNSVRWLGNEDS